MYKLSIYCLLFILIMPSCDSGPQAIREANHVENEDYISPDLSEEIEVTEGRAAWQKPKLVIDKLGDLAGKTIADIGAGTGYFSFRMCFKDAKVIAVDIDQDMLDFMNELSVNLPEDKIGNFETRLATETDPMLADEEADIIIIVNTIAYIGNRVEYLRNLKDKLKEGGKIMILDFKMKQILKINAPSREERIALYQMEDELISAGFSNISSDDQSLDYQYIIFGEK